MQPPNRSIGIGPGAGNAGDEPDGGEGGSPESIREMQRRRRDAARMRADIQAILATPDEEEEDEAEPASGLPQPAPARVWVVFRGTSWTDPGGSLRESDNIVGVYATEEAARRTAAALNKETAAAAGEGDAWYQPYTVEA